MPQMFPLLWLTLFMATAIALFMVMASVHFSSKKSNTFMQMQNKFKDHAWKW